MSLTSWMFDDYLVIDRGGEVVAAAPTRDLAEAQGVARGDPFPLVIPACRYPVYQAAKRARTKKGGSA